MARYNRISQTIEVKKKLKVNGAPVWIDKFLVKANSPRGGVLRLANLGQITFPEDMLGKRVRLKLEVVD